MEQGIRVCKNEWGEIFSRQMKDGKRGREREGRRKEEKQRQGAKKGMEGKKGKGKGKAREGRKTFFTGEERI